MYRFSTLLFALCSSVVFSQGITISGRIVDSETLEPLPFAHVFIDQTTIGAVSDVNGEYALEHVYEGKYKLVFSYVGYELYFSEVSVGAQDIRVSARLVPDMKLLAAVEVKGTKDKEWEHQLKQFTKVFFGDNSLARECTILNPWVLEFVYDRFDKVFKATASAPLQIENKALGYNIECTLQGFSFDQKQYKINGLYKFVEVNTLDAKEAQKWTRNRRYAYQSSLRFLFKSIADKHEAQNGFHLYLDKRPPKYKATTEMFSNELGTNVFEFSMDDVLAPAGPGFFKITTEGKIEVHHTTEYATTKSYRDVPFPVSWIESEKGVILFSKNGFIMNNDQIVTAGEFNKNRVAAMLPLNYSPGSLVVVNYLTKRMIAKRLQEKVHITTDKGFYYPGERLWFKGYTNYANQSVRDSLSKVLYVELISPSKKIIQTKIVRSDSAFGDFLLNDEWEPGIYYMRAYTNWMRNYGSEVIFYRPFVLMNSNQRIISTASPTKSGDFNFEIEQRAFLPNEKIKFSVLLDSSGSEKSSTVSVSVVPVGHAMVPGEFDIRQSLFFPEDMPVGTLTDFIHPCEDGLNINGQLFRPKKRYTSGQMSVIQGKMDSLFIFKTDYKGNFKIEGLTFYDTTRFSFRAKDKRGRIFGQTRLLPYKAPEVAALPVLDESSLLDTIALQSPVVFQKKLLIEPNLEVKQKPNVSVSEPINSSGVNLVITEEQFQGMPGSQSIVYALQGRVPGFQINPTTGQVSFHGRDASSSEPLFVVDGIPYSQVTSSSVSSTSLSERQSTETSGSTSGSSSNRGNNIGTNNQTPPQPNMTQSSTVEMLSHIFVDQVSYVEVSTSMDPRYGSMGANGVISIYTKSALGKNKVVKTFDEFIVEGFARSSTFIPADSVNLNFSGDYSPTIYWNPSLSISTRQPTEITIQCPVKPGKYIIRVEGLSAEGRPVSGWIDFEVK